MFRTFRLLWFVKFAPAEPSYLSLSKSSLEGTSDELCAGQRSLSLIFRTNSTLLANQTENKQGRAQVGPTVDKIIIIVARCCLVSTQVVVVVGNSVVCFCHCLSFFFPSIGELQVELSLTRERE